MNARDAVAATRELRQASPAVVSFGDFTYEESEYTPVVEACKGDYSRETHTSTLPDVLLRIRSGDDCALQLLRDISHDCKAGFISASAKSRLKEAIALRYSARLHGSTQKASLDVLRVSSSSLSSPCKSGDSVLSDQGAEGARSPVLSPPGDLVVREYSADFPRLGAATANLRTISERQETTMKVVFGVYRREDGGDRNTRDPEARGRQSLLLQRDNHFVQKAEQGESYVATVNKWFVATGTTRSRLLFREAFIACHYTSNKATIRDNWRYSFIAVNFFRPLNLFELRRELDASTEKVLREPNAGGSSINSEALSIEVLAVSWAKQEITLIESQEE